MPSSRVRCTTEYAMTPYSPTAVSASAVAGEPREEGHDEPAAGQRVAEVVPHRTHVRDRQLGIDRVDLGDHRWREARGIAAGPHHQRHRIPGPLGLGPVEGRTRQRIDAGVVHVPDDADDGAAQGVAPRHDDPLAQDGPRRRGSARRSSGSPRPPWAAPRRPGREGTPLEQRNSHGAEVVGCHRLDVSAGPLAPAAERDGRRSRESVAERRPDSGSQLTVAGRASRRAAPGPG